MHPVAMTNGSFDMEIDHGRCRAWLPGSRTVLDHCRPGIAPLSWGLAWAGYSLWSNKENVVLQPAV
jgi:hypothetical protein